jgi:O-antigen/teichoic acid export membrane protein
VTQLQAAWNQFNSRERLSAIGAGLLILAWIVGLFTYGIGTSTISLLGAIAVLAILYVKYTPTMNVTWPAPVSLLVLVVSAVIALLVLLDLLQILPYLGLARYFGGAVILVLILEVVGAALMAWGAWQEYQVVKPAMPNFGSTTSSTPPPPAATTPPPAAAPPVDSTDEAPPV